MTECIIRPAQKSEAADLAILDNLAGFGMTHWFWQQSVNRSEAKDAFSLGRKRMTSDEIFAWRNAYVAVVDGMIAGSITSYPMPEVATSEIEDVKKNAPPFVPVSELFALANDSWFIDIFAIYEEYRGRGLGESLLKNSLMRGRSSQKPKAMLICEDTNKPARTLYEKYDFQVVDERPFISFGTDQKTEKWLLMSAEY